MSLEITSVVNASTPGGEAVKLKATADVNLRGYAIVDRTFTTTGVPSDEFRHIFIFPSTDVKKNETIEVHSGKASYRKAGSVHHFYWGASSCVWNDKGGDVASLIKYTRVGGMKVSAL